MLKEVRDIEDFKMFQDSNNIEKVRNVEKVINDMILKAINVVNRILLAIKKENY